MDAKQFLIDFHDYMVPKLRLDTYEQAIYLYIVRQSRLLENTDAIVAFKSIRKKMAFGVGTRGSAMSEGTCYEKLKSLESKGLIEILASERTGTRVAPRLPSEIPGLIAATLENQFVDLEDEDFFALPEQRERILAREDYRCFYCLCRLNGENYVIEHVTSRPTGNGSYRNVVAACRRCNNRKGEMNAIDYFRQLLREQRLSDQDFDGRRAMLEKLNQGELKPPQRNGP